MLRRRRSMVAAMGVGGGAAVPAPAAPTGLTATLITLTQIDLAWTDNATDETAYRVYRSTNGIDYAQIGIDQPEDTQSYSDTTISAGTTYYYKVAAVNDVGETMTAAAIEILVLAYDTFTGANSTALTAHTPNVDAAAGGWLNMKQKTTVTGTPANQIQSNQARLSPDLHGVAIDTGEADVTVLAHWVPASASLNRGSVIVRYTSDGNLWRFTVREDEDDVQLAEENADTATLRAGPSAYNFVEGTTYRLKVVCSGNTITCYVNEVQVLQYTSATFNNTATRHGMMRNVGSDAMRFDNFEVAAINPM